MFPSEVERVVSKLNKIFGRGEVAAKLAHAQAVLEELQDIDRNVGICAGVLADVLEHHQLSSAFVQWDSLQEIARRPSELSTDEARHLRSRSTVIAFWSWEIFEHYRWDKTHYRFLERLAEIAKTTQWSAFVERMNCVLIKRHEDSLTRGSIGRLGLEDEPYKHSFQSADLDRYRQNSEKYDEKQRERLVMWITRSYEGIELDGRSMTERFAQNIPYYHVRLDRHGLVRSSPENPKPAKPPRPRQQKRKSPANGGDSSKPSKRSKDKTSGLLTPSPSEDEPDKAASNASSYLLLQIETVTPSDACPMCKSSCVFCKIGEGWPEEVANDMFDAAHDAFELSKIVDNSKISPWIHPLQFASCSTDPSIAKPTVQEAEADVLFLTSQTVYERQERGEVFDKPVLIRGCVSDNQTHSFDNYSNRLRDIYYDGNIDDQLDGPSHQGLSIDQFIDRLRRGMPSNALSLPNISNVGAPSFVRLQRNQLLHDLTFSVERSYQSTRGKMVRYVDVASCKDFNILGGRGAFSGAHVDALNGTWLMNLFGRKLWFTVPLHSMTNKDWTDFALDGDSWNPGTKARAVLVRPGDGLLMPAGFLLIHAVFTLETCQMEGGTIWDICNLLSILKNIYWISCNQSSTNEPVPYQFSEILNHLSSRLKTGRLGDSSKSSEITEAIQDLRSLGCTCKRSSKCSKTCKCKLAQRRCTPLCLNHICGNQSKLEWRCMEEN